MQTQSMKFKFDVIHFKIIIEYIFQPVQIYYISIHGDKIIHIVPYNSVSFIGGVAAQ